MMFILPQDVSHVGNGYTPEILGFRCTVLGYKEIGVINGIFFIGIQNFHSIAAGGCKICFDSGCYVFQPFR